MSEGKRRKKRRLILKSYCDRCGSHKFVYYGKLVDAKDQGHDVLSCAKCGQGFTVPEENVVEDRRKIPQWLEKALG